MGAQEVAGMAPGSQKTLVINDALTPAAVAASDHGEKAGKGWLQWCGHSSLIHFPQVYQGTTLSWGWPDGSSGKDTCRQA